MLICGNGGSAADSQHLAAELVGKFKEARQAFAAVSLASDPAVLTCVANDFGYTEVFSRQVQALGQPGDVLIAISTSGKSPNILRAVECAEEMALFTIALTRKGSPLESRCDLAITVDSPSTARIQEAHLFAEHMLCEYIEQSF